MGGRAAILKKMLAIVAAAAALGIIAGAGGGDDAGIKDGKLPRAESGEGSYEADLQLYAEGEEDAIDYVVEVPEQKLTKKEEAECLAAAREELESRYGAAAYAADAGGAVGEDASDGASGEGTAGGAVGEDASDGASGEDADAGAGTAGLFEVRGGVELAKTLQDGKVKAKWDFDKRGILDEDGTVIAEDLPEEGEILNAEVALTCGDSGSALQFAFLVMPRVLTAREALLRDVGEQIKEQEDDAGEEYLSLPETAGGRSLKWEEEGDAMPAKVLALGIAVACLMPFLEKSRRQEMEKKRGCQMELAYPDIVSRMALLLRAGMTLQGAWRKIALSYEKKRDGKETPEQAAYEEMLRTVREMESGVGEQRAYEHFGDRCGLTPYRRFTSLLSQNLRKGSKGLVDLLEQEAENAFEERKTAAKRYGEEAATKLLFPMMLMLGIVMLLLLVPAILTFKM